MAEQDLDDAHVRSALQKDESRTCAAGYCTVTCLLKPAAAQAERQAACKGVARHEQDARRRGRETAIASVE